MLKNFITGHSGWKALLKTNVDDSSKAFRKGWYLDFWNELKYVSVETTVWNIAQKKKIIENLTWNVCVRRN